MGRDRIGTFIPAVDEAVVTTEVVETEGRRSPQGVFLRLTGRAGGTTGEPPAVFLVEQMLSGGVAWSRSHCW